MLVALLGHEYQCYRANIVTKANIVVLRRYGKYNDVPHVSNNVLIANWHQTQNATGMSAES